MTKKMEKTWFCSSKFLIIYISFDYLSFKNSSWNSYPEYKTTASYFWEHPTHNNKLPNNNKNNTYNVDNFLTTYPPLGLLLFANQSNKN